MEQIPAKIVLWYEVIFAMKNFISMTLVILFSILCLSACGGDTMIAAPPQNPEETTDIDTEPPQPPADDPEDTLPPGDVGSVKVLYNSIDWRENMDSSLIIRSVEELRKFSEDLNVTKANGYDDDVISRLTGEQYDEAFFSEHFLVMITVSESSGSNRHELSSIADDNGVLSIEIERHLPEVGTTDMAGWLITIELSNNYSITDTSIIFTDVSLDS